MGCIRLTTRDAKWIYDNVSLWTKVEFYSSSNPGPFGKPSAQKISNAPGNLKNWDPTDPAPNNPWKTYKPGQDDTKNEEKNDVKNDDNKNTVENNSEKNESINNVTNSEKENNTINENNEVINNVENTEENNVINNIINDTDSNTLSNNIVKHENTENELTNTEKK